MTNEELADAVAKIVALDAKRTREEWLAFEWRKMPHGVDPGEGGFIDNGQLFFDESQNTHEDIATVYSDADLHFIAAAPLMAQVIRQLWEEREANRTVMEQAREALSDCKDYVDSENLTMQTKHRHWGDILAALDAVLGIAIEPFNANKEY